MGAKQPQSIPKGMKKPDPPPPPPPKKADVVIVKIVVNPER